MAGDSDSIHSRDSTELDSPLQKKPKIEANEEELADPPPGFFYAGERLLPMGSSKDPEYIRQCDIFYDQFEKSEGFDVDWDNLGYMFGALNFAWQRHSDPHQSKEEMIKELTQAAIDEYNEENVCLCLLLLSFGTEVEFVEHVSANTMGCRVILYYITFWAKDVSSQDPEPKRYQAKVQKFAYEINVVMVRLRPTQD